jgi:hypothetical protein
MAVLIIERWNPGLNKVALAKLLHSRAHVSLSLAKQCVDQLLEGNEVALDVPSLVDASEIARDAETFGAVAFVSKKRGRGHGSPVDARISGE